MQGGLKGRERPSSTRDILPFQKQHEEAWDEGRGGTQSRGAQAGGVQVQQQPGIDKFQGSNL